VNHPDPSAVHLHHPPLGKRHEERGLVHVPRHRLHRSEPFQLFEHGRTDDVAGVEDQVGVLQAPKALPRQPPLAARHVGVGDDGDGRQPVPSRNAPSR
jgi:hypothetical protein